MNKALSNVVSLEFHNKNTNKKEKTFDQILKVAKFIGRANYKTKSIYILGIAWIIALFFIWQEYNASENIKKSDLKIQITKDIEIYSRANARFQVQNIANCIVKDIEQNKYTTFEQMQLSIHKCWSKKWWFNLRYICIW